MTASKLDPADDPFEMLQELISDGSLIKEAVRRLQLGLTATLAQPKQQTKRNFYDSDDECRTPPMYPEIADIVAADDHHHDVV